MTIVPHSLKTTIVQVCHWQQHQLKWQLSFQYYFINLCIVANLTFELTIGIVLQAGDYSFWISKCLSNCCCFKQRFCYYFGFYLLLISKTKGAQLISLHQLIQLLSVNFVSHLKTSLNWLAVVWLVLTSRTSYPH